MCPCKYLPVFFSGTNLLAAGWVFPASGGAPFPFGPCFKISSTCSLSTNSGGRSQIEVFEDGLKKKTFPSPVQTRCQPKGIHESKYHHTGVGHKNGDYQDDLMFLDNR